MFLAKHLKFVVVISWVLNFLAIFYFGYISWWAAVDFNGITSMVFGIPFLLILLVTAYVAGSASEKSLGAGGLSKRVSLSLCVLMGLFYLSGYFSSMERVTNFPIKLMTKVSKVSTGKTPDQWINQ